jgi:hypothetical protein
MNVTYSLCGFSKNTDELVFELDLDEHKDDLIKLFNLDKNDPFVDIRDVINDTQKYYFEKKYGVAFDQSNNYSIHIYQA